MKKIVLTILICFILVGGAAGYFFVSVTISDNAIKKRLLSTLNDYGETNIGHAHLDLLEGLTVDNLLFFGTKEDLAGKNLKISKFILKLAPESLIKGQLKILRAVAIKPELTIEKPRSIWELLNALKTYLDQAKTPIFMDMLPQGIEVRDLSIHIKEDLQMNRPEIALSGINVTFVPYAGSFKEIAIQGSIDDEFFGSYSFVIRLRPDIPRLDLEIKGKNIVLDENFLTHFPFFGNKLWTDYRPVGTVDMSCAASFDNHKNQEKSDYQINISPKNLEASYSFMPVSISHLNGSIELSGGKVYLKELVGYLKTGNSASQVEIKGLLGLADPEKTLLITVPNVFVNQDLLQKIPVYGNFVSQKVAPAGLVDIDFQYNENRERKKSYFLTVHCKDLELHPTGFPFPVYHVSGPLKLSDNVLLLNNASGFIQCGNQDIFTEIRGVYDLKSGRKAFRLFAPSLSVTENLLNNLPNKAFSQKLSATLNPRGKVDLGVHYQGFQDKGKDTYSMELVLKECEAQFQKYNISLRGIEGTVNINKERIVSKHIDAKYCGGHIEGTILVDLNAEPFRYEGEVGFSRVILEDLARKIANTETPWAGLMDGRITYWGNGADVKNFHAEGHLNVNEGFLSEVPIILSIFNFFNLSLPKKESFHSARIKFSVDDGSVHITDGRIFSDTIELNGQGDIGLNGDLNLTVVTGFSKDLLSRLPIVGRVFDFVVGGVRKQLSFVEIKGTFLKPEAHSIPFKPITRSIRSVFEAIPKDEQETTDGIGSE
ncbi:MAG: AsmA-like C-terminal region-containing protein [Candidatus Brocadiaceae bacterium]|nr:AsmA-like C-terminal region-containing protein [Candidatus Brocadiaceae bacterium]